jgi:hypothetical protein
MKTPFGSFDMSSMASTFAPAELPTVNAETVGHNIVVGDGGGVRITQALELSNGSAHWAGGPTATSVTPMETPDSALVWAVPATFMSGVGIDEKTLTGTEYVTSPTDVEFVDKAGDVFDQHAFVYGLFPVENLYYDPVNGPAVDEIQTIFGSVDISPLASWFAPADVADLVTPAPVADLADAGLYSALDLLPDLTA